jgi:hypothetical protein
MVKNCPNCGVQIKSEFKFCPECGFKFEEEKPEPVIKNSTGNVGIIVCNNCGDENLSSNKFCSGCGVILQGEVIAEKGSFGTHTAKETPAQKIQHSKKVKAVPITKVDQGKQLDVSKIILIVTVGIIAVFIILIASGTFDSKPSVTTGIPQNQMLAPGVTASTQARLSELEVAVKENPADSKALLELAHLKNDSGLFEQAIINYKQYLEINPSDANARIDMGVSYYNLADYKNAEEEMKKALEYEPSHQIGHLNLGIVNLAAGNLEISRQWLKKAVDINPNSEIGIKAQELLASH